jgi:hypothetical protein
MKDDVARMLEMLDKLSQGAGADNPALSERVKTEIAAQSRTNPKVVQKLAQRVADDGEDPADVLGSYLPSSEVEKLQRSGRLAVKATKAPAQSATPRRLRAKLGQPAKPETSAAAAPPPPKPEAEPKDAGAAEPKEAKDAGHEPDKEHAKPPHKPVK